MSTTTCRSRQAANVCVNVARAGGGGCPLVGDVNVCWTGAGARTSSFVCVCLCVFVCVVCGGVDIVRVDCAIVRVAWEGWFGVIGVAACFVGARRWMMSGTAWLVDACFVGGVGGAPSRCTPLVKFINGLVWQEVGLRECSPSNENNEGAPGPQSTATHFTNNQPTRHRAATSLDHQPTNALHQTLANQPLCHPTNQPPKLGPQCAPAASTNQPIDLQNRNNHNNSCPPPPLRPHHHRCTPSHTS
jgi:hypothetical protein